MCGKTWNIQGENTETTNHEARRVAADEEAHGRHIFINANLIAKLPEYVPQITARPGRQ